MKKIVILCTALIAVALLLVGLTACTDKTDDDTTTTTDNGYEQTVVIDGVEYSVLIGEDSAVIKKDGVEFQTLKYPTSKTNFIDLEYAKEHFEFVDMNFDGVADFYIATNYTDGNISFYCWIYNATDDCYDYNVMLSGLKNISVDTAKQRILSSGVTNDGINVVNEYRWENGSLVYKASYGREEEIPEDVSQSAGQNTIGGNKNETTTAPSVGITGSGNNSATTVQTTEKPLDTTTTEPVTKGDGVYIGNSEDLDEGWV